MTEPFVSQADGYVRWLRERVGHQLIYLVYTTVLVFDEQGRILVQRRYDFDWLGVPGGALELGEGLRDCAIRETREETGLEVAIGRLVGVFSHPDFNLHYPNGDRVQQWSVCVVAHPVGGELRADGAETLHLEWLPVAEALPQFPPAYRAMIQAAQQSENGALEPVYAAPVLTPYYPILRARIGHQCVILPGAMAVVRDDQGRVLMARRTEDGLLDVVGGYSDLGETTTHTAIRETREETGLDVEPVRLIGVYSEGMESGYTNGDRLHAVGAAYECRVIGGKLRADHAEISEVGFRPVRDLLGQQGAIPPGQWQLWDDIQHPERWPVLR